MCDECQKAEMFSDIFVIYLTLSKSYVNINLRIVSKYNLRREFIMYDIYVDGVRVATYDSYFDVATSIAFWKIIC